MSATGQEMPLVPDGLFERARRGDNVAWEQIFAECSPKLIRAIRRRLGGPMRSLYDSTDFVNDVFKSLVAKSDRFEFADLEALKAHLIQSAQRKIMDEYRRQHRQKRDRSRERPLSPGGPEDGGFEPAGSEPTPSQYAQAREMQTMLLSGSDAQGVQVLEMKSQHYSNEEVAAQTGLHLRAIQRFLKKIFDTRFVRA
jgi:RNA polymerase sigma-70 factor (ECF subfamily)